MIRPALDEIFINKNETMLLLIPLAVFFITVIGAAANYGNMFYMRFVGQRIVADMQIRVFEHLMKSDIGLFHEQSSGRLISRFTNDINLLRNAFTSVLTGAGQGHADHDFPGRPYVLPESEANGYCHSRLFLGRLSADPARQAHAPHLR